MVNTFNQTAHNRSQNKSIHIVLFTLLPCQLDIAIPTSSWTSSQIVHSRPLRSDTRCGCNPPFCQQGGRGS